jgi:hypothetical protein
VADLRNVVVRRPVLLGIPQLIRYPLRQRKNIPFVMLDEGGQELNFLQTARGAAQNRHHPLS